MLGLPGEPKDSGTMRSPFRDESNPSFSIFDNGRGFKDHGGEGACGDGVEFARVALRTDHAGVRDWWMERSGIDYFDHGDGKASSRPAKAPAPPKRIEWPAELIEGTSATWKAFADLREILAKEIESFIDSDELIRMRAIESAERETLANTNLEDLLP
jgi:hypothetical protein